MALDLDYWTADIVSRQLGGRPDLGNVTLREAIDIYTEEKLRENFEYAKANSRFYGKKLAGIDVTGGASGGNGGASGSLGGASCGEVPAGWEDVPFTTVDELCENGMDFLCVSPADISRIVTMQTSGTTGDPKRIYFTKEDQELTVDFFDHGMRLICDETDTVLILMPAASEGSIGKLLGEGLRRFGARTIEYGVPFMETQTATLDGGDAGTSDGATSPAEGATWKQSSRAEEADKILQLIRDEGVTSVVATPTHMVALARAMERQAAAGEEEIYLRSILLSAEFVPNKTVMMLEEVFQAMVFEHYGMTEMGLGCAVSCGYGKGYHIRETDIFIELINPITGEVVRGESPKTPGYSNFGEIVFTTLTRKGMPFIRYRTGDFSRWILDPCPCGSQMKRLDKVYPGEGRE